MTVGMQYLPRLMNLASAYKAKLLCSGVFLAQREAQSLLTEDLSVDDLAPLRLVKSNIHPDQKTVTASWFGRAKRTAVYRPGLGSTLIFDSTLTQLTQQSKQYEEWYQQTPRHNQGLPVTTQSQQNQSPLEHILGSAFTESQVGQQKRTRAIVIVHQGKILAERYASGFSAETPLLGWSMTKSVVNALIGILIHQGKLSLEQDNLFPDWWSSNDPRSKITLDQLLRMSSGLAFSEEYSNPLADATTMLFQRGNSAAYAAQSRLTANPDTVCHYASGTSVLLCQLIQQTLGPSWTDYFAFPRRALFDPLGMASAILEPDETGIFTGSSFMYATARDWAKFGLLYLQDGIWQGKRILPPGWVTYSTTPNPTYPGYAAHFWRQVPQSFASQQQPKPAWPADAYLASGYQGQFVTVIPAHDLVVVRLGLAQRRKSWDHESFIDQVIQALAISD